MIVALFFLGTWPALLNLLERRGRNPVHTYLDYSLTNFLVAIIIALTLGQIGPAKPGEPNFTTQLSQVCRSRLTPACLCCYTAVLIGVRGRCCSQCHRQPWTDYVFIKCFVPAASLSGSLQHNGPSVGFAMAGGVFLCCGNLATQYSLVTRCCMSALRACVVLLSYTARWVVAVLNAARHT